MFATFYVFCAFMFQSSGDLGVFGVVLVIGALVSSAERDAATGCAVVAAADADPRYITAAGR